MEEMNENGNERKIAKSVLKPMLKSFLIIGLFIFIASTFFTFSLREVYLNDSADRSVKDHKAEYKELAEEDED